MRLGFMDSVNVAVGNRAITVGLHNNRSGKNSHITRISISVTYPWSFTNTAIIRNAPPEIARNDMVTADIATPSANITH